jgi:alpha-L-rhamnosidase
MSRAWDAKWIGYRYDPREDIGVFAFRRRFELSEIPDSLIVNISADQRYKLFVNDRMICFGPQRGDVRHWFFEAVDLAPYLVAGRNTITVLVWNFGWLAPMAQCSSGRTAFVLESAILGSAHPSLSTPEDWEVVKLDWDFSMMHRGVGEFYIDVGPGEFIGALDTIVPLSTSVEGSEVLRWEQPHVICRAEERGAGGGGTPWMLVPRTIPAMRHEMRSQNPTIRTDYDPRSAEVVRRLPEGEQTAPVLADRWDLPVAEGGSSEPYTPPATFELPLALQGPVLLDFEELLCAYPSLELSGPAGAMVTLTYDESLWNPDGTKGNRDQVAGKHLRGYQDKIVLNGSRHIYEPLWWRTFRYILLEVAPPAQNAGEEGDVLVHSLRIHETGFPLEVESSFEADDPWVRPLWDVSVRTAQRCAGETYFDCPYWEQLQYVGDTRIQALIGYYLGRDRALQRNAVETLGWSLMENGLTQSRYPARQVQVIPPFSLFWTQMVADSIMYDREPSAEILEQAERVLRHQTYRQSEGKFWHFTDWVPDWKWGVPPKECQLGKLQEFLAFGWSPSALLELHAMTPEQLESLSEAGAEFLESFSASVDVFMRKTGAVERHDEPEVSLRSARRGATPTEHGEALTRVWQLLVDADVDPWPQQELASVGAAKCTYYFSYYKHLAMFGRPEDAAAREGKHYPYDYLQELEPWKEMIEEGLTTFAENPEPTRSDCHAWSAHPILGFFQIVAGVMSTAPCWKKARIMPHPGSLKRFDARIAHPDGELRVKWEDDHLHIETPVEAELRWRGRCEALAPGMYKIP